MKITRRKKKPVTGDYPPNKASDIAPNLVQNLTKNLTSSITNLTSSCSPNGNPTQSSAPSIGEKTLEENRREFFKQMATITMGATVLSLAEAKPFMTPPRREGDESKRYGMVVDLRRCIGCQACTVSCAIENQAPPGQFRTTVRQYQVVNNETNEATNVMLPRLCNHCDEAPCIPVCPTQATFQRKDGIVVVDSDICMGCAYCVQACPYEARFINKDTGTADKCNFCVHRLEVGLLPACVESCVGGARIIGDLKDPNSEINRLINQHHDEIKVLKPEQGTIPYVFYIGLDEAFTSQVEGQSMLWEEVKL